MAYAWQIIRTHKRSKFNFFLKKGKLQKWPYRLVAVSAQAR